MKKLALIRSSENYNAAMASKADRNSVYNNIICKVNGWNSEFTDLTDLTVYNAT